MDTKRLLTVAKRIEVLEGQLASLKNEARQIVAGQLASPLRKGKKMSAAARRKISEAMKRRWAVIKKKS
ncbi:MAG: hypothetical protein WBN92_14050 [Terriglobia bacterium]